MVSAASAIPEEVWSDLAILWNYHDMHHEARKSDIGIGLGSHDLGVAICTAELFKQGLFPRIVFTGANAPTTIERFPRGEAVHYREKAMELGVPDEAILVEPEATNTGENIQLTRKLLSAQSIEVSSVTLISRPYQQRRAYATCKMFWPEVTITCASLPLSLPDYIEAIGDADRVINMIVGDTQRIIELPKFGFAIPQEMPSEVHEAYERLVSVGYTTRLIK
ncbi:YdcF family protein [Streptosporangium canum]|uniref:YdcF family protein n=1 Tax=Streptosporangium canum TaxID=324952 RepID=UPI003441268C